MKRLIAIVFLCGIGLSTICLSVGEQCGDLICGKWRSPSGVVLQIAPSRIWLGPDFEATLSVTGPSFSSGFTVGDIVYRVNKAGKGQYTGEQLRKFQEKPIGWSS